MSTADTTSQIDGAVVPDPTPHNLGRLSTSTLSMRNKKQLKRHANAQHNSNFHAGYVPITEDVLHRSGIRGRKRYFLYCTIATLMFVAFVNILITAWLLYLLGMTHNGLAYLETINVASRSLVHFFGPAVASRFLLNGVPLGAKHAENLNVTSQNSPININSFGSSKFSPMISLNGSTITVLADTMRVKDNDSKDWTSLDVETISKTHGISNYFVNSLTTRKIQNYEHVNDLYLESPVKKVKVNGSKAVHIQSMKDVDITARGIFVQSNCSVVFQSKQSVYLDPNLPRATTSRSSARPQANKICVCGNGKLFFVPGVSPTSCNIGKNMAIKVCRL